MLYSLSLCLSLAMATPGVVRFELTREEPHAFAKRAAENVTVALQNRVNQFVTELLIGSNQQRVRTIVDTGSADLWVMSRSNPYCMEVSSNDDTVDNTSSSENGQIVCSEHAMFNTSASSSWHPNTTSFSISYQDTSFANGTFGQDTVSYGGISISNANFAVADQTNVSTGVWGIGLTSTESMVRKLNADGTFGPTYPNLPQQMKQQGVIGQNAYSLWLNDLNASEGTLLFGGVDHSKYTGNLQTVPLLASYQGAKPNRLQIMLNSLSVYQGQDSTVVASFALPALLDSGSTLMIMPAPLLNPLAESVGLVYSGNNGYVGVCGLEGGLSLNFSGAEIDIPFSEIEFPLGKDNLCVYGVLPSEDSYFLLGDTFLRSAYVVYDLDNLEISLANTRYNATNAEPSIEAISGTVPGATRAAGYSSTNVASTYSTNIATNFKTQSFSGTITTSQYPSGTISSEQVSTTVRGTGIASSQTASGTSSSSPSTTTGKKNNARRNAASFPILAAAALLF